MKILRRRTAHRTITVLVLAIIALFCTQGASAQRGGVAGKTTHTDRIATADTATPIIYVDDIVFGPFDLSETRILPLSITNEGGGTITFHDPFFTSPQSEFSISADDIAALKKAALGPGQSITVLATFKSTKRGFYHNTVRFWASTRQGRDTSNWSANALQPLPYISGHDWGKSWVTASNACTRDSMAAYSADLVVADTGNDDYILNNIQLFGDDALNGYFVLDTVAQGTIIAHGDTISHRRIQRVFFRPKEERAYQCVVVLSGRVGDATWGSSDTAIAFLHGTGVESHLTVSDADFGITQFRGDTSGIISTSAMVTLSASNSQRYVTITGVRVDDPRFTVLGVARSNGAPTPLTPPLVISAGQRTELVLFCTMRAADAGTISGHLIVSGDFSRCDDSVGELTARVISAAAVQKQSDPRPDRIEPNPSSGLTTIHFTLGDGASTTVEIQDETGRRITLLDQGYLDAGEHMLRWNAENIPSGLYYCRIISGSQNIIRPILLVR